MRKTFWELFGVEKPVIGMIHLSGKGAEKMERAIDELAIYEDEGVSGAIVEDYHGFPEDIGKVLEESSKDGIKILKGINVLRSPYSSFEIADRFGAGFVQFDSVQTRDLFPGRYSELREKFPNILVLGGIGFKYTFATGNPLHIDLEDGKSRCEAIVTTGIGTGVETPIEKLRQYKELLENFPLVVGAGVNLKNVYEQLSVADGAIVGSYFKPNGDTLRKVDRSKVRDLMDIVRDARRNFR